MSLMQTTAGGFSRAVLTYIGSALYTTATSQTARTVSTSIGTAPSADRWVIVAFQHGLNTATTVASATINGVSASLGYNTASSTGIYGHCVFYAKVPTGSGAVTITANLSAARTAGTGTFGCRFYVYTLTGRTTLTYSASTFPTGSGTTVTNSTLASNVYSFNLYQWSASAFATAGVWSGTGITTGGNSSDNYGSIAAYDGLSSGGITPSATFTTSNSIGLVGTIGSSWTYV
jgi:hypothetical protein